VETLCIDWNSEPDSAEPSVLVVLSHSLVWATHRKCGDCDPHSSAAEQWLETLVWMFLTVNSKPPSVIPSVFEKMSDVVVADVWKQSNTASSVVDCQKFPQGSQPTGEGC
jgi:hypothetical protein